MGNHKFKGSVPLTRPFPELRCSGVRESSLPASDEESSESEELCVQKEGYQEALSILSTPDPALVALPNPQEPKEDSLPWASHHALVTNHSAKDHEGTFPSPSAWMQVLWYMPLALTVSLSDCGSQPGGNRRGRVEKRDPCLVLFSCPVTGACAGAIKLCAGASPWSRIPRCRLTGPVQAQLLLLPRDLLPLPLDGAWQVLYHLLGVGLSSGVPAAECPTFPGKPLSVFNKQANPLIALYLDKMKFTDIKNVKMDQRTHGSTKKEGERERRKGDGRAK
eukprot:1138838-Pelagomonas_calceolata.AAC.5